MMQDWQRKLISDVIDDTFEMAIKACVRVAEQRGSADDCVKILREALYIRKHILTEERNVR
jgi:hypothetical protein